MTQDSEGVFILGSGCWVSFTAGLTVNTGGFFAAPDSEFDGATIAGGTLTLVSSCNPGVDQYYVGSGLELDGGSVQFGYTSGASEVLHVAGNLIANPGSSLTVNVNGAVNGQSDLLDVGGFAELVNANLIVATQEGSPASGNTYTVLTAQQGYTGNWASIYNTGFPASYSNDPSNPGQLVVE